MTFTFLHAADLHLDTPFTEVGGYPAEVGAALREASLEAWDDLVDVAIGREVSFVLLAGDVYDGAERGIRAQRAFQAGVTRLAEHGIRTLLVHGNHDPVQEGWTAIRELPSLVTVFGTDEVESVRFTVDGQDVVVHGISYATAATEENLALRFPAATDQAFHIGLLHANLGGIGSKHADYSPCSIDDLRRAGYQYWALGHIHTRTVVQDAEPMVVYPGNLQGRNPRQAERGAKGAVLVSVTDGRPSQPELVPLDRVRFVDVTVSIDHYADVASLIDQLQRLASPSAHQGRGVLVRATIEGSGPLHQELVAPHRRDEVLAELRRSGASADPFVWWERLEWRTRSSVDVIDIRRREDFVSDLLRYMDATEQVERERWAEQLPAEVARELGQLLPAVGDTTIWEAAHRAALEAVTEVDP